MTETALHPTRAGRRFYAAAITTALAVGALQMYHVRGGFLTDYGADVFGTAWLYAMTRLGWTIIQRRRPAPAAASAMIVFAGCTISEFGQRVHLVPGTFDRFDIVAYGITSIVCYAVDRAIPFVATRAD